MHDQGHAIDFVPNVGHSTVRAQVIGNDYVRTATPQQMASMQWPRWGDR